MISGVLVDTGPLVAAINRKDRFHEWALARFGEIAPPLLTCEAVLAESCFLLRQYPGGSAAVWELLHRGIVQTPFRIGDHIAPIRKLMAKYDNIPMSVADACLVRMSEIEPGAAIMTLDSDFRVYRRHGRQTIPLIAPKER